MRPATTLGIALALVILAVPRGASSEASSCAPVLRPRIAEILYDAEGDDTGKEFVELFNPHSRSVSLAGARLEAGDGSGPGRWWSRWTGGVGDSVPPLGRFVVGGARVSPAPDRVAELGLQNGPDAVRLVWPDGQVEVVGYGTHDFPEYFCGAPAVDGPSGQSLARIPDDADGGSNAADFRAASPSPGRANQAATDLALLGRSLAVAPEQPAAFEAIRLGAEVINRGRLAVAAARVLVLDGESADSLLGSPLSFVPAPGETVSWSATLPGLPAGKRRLLARVLAAGDEAPENDWDSTRVRVGAGPLEITEIQFHPASGEGEWVEVRNREPRRLVLEHLRIADRRGTTGRLQSPLELPAESLAVLVQDRPALLRRFPALDTTRVLAVTPWPGFNNSDQDGIADAVVLREEDGTPIERVEYSARGVPAGAAIERREGIWLPSSDPAGTPLRMTALPMPAAGGFEITPRMVRRGGATGLRWSLPWPRARASCEVFDLAGRSRGVLMAETLVPGRAEKLAGLGELDPGLYVVLLRARPEVGEGGLHVARALRVER